MNKKDIELELRAEIPVKKFANFKKKLSSLGKILSETRRLSVMYFGEVNDRKIDIRVRVTNGDCEIALKYGSFSAIDRVEITQPINKEQFLGMIRLFSIFKFKTKVGERETINFKIGNDVTVSLVLAKTIVYIELECMSTKSDLKNNEKKLRKIAEMLDLQILKSDDEFNELCDRLSNKVDWKFNGTKEDYKKLNILIGKYFLNA